MNHPKFAIAAVFISVLILGACSGGEEEINLTAEQERAMSERLAPDGELAIAGQVSAPATIESNKRNGQDIYQGKCVTCHDSGVAGAPKIGAVNDWKDRLGKGMDVLYTSAISGLNGMPAKGLCFDCSDEEIKAAVDYMIEGVQ
jgi:cytochrome c5